MDDRKVSLKLLVIQATVPKAGGRNKAISCSSEIPKKFHFQFNITDFSTMKKIEYFFVFHTRGVFPEVVSLCFGRLLESLFKLRLSLRWA